VRRAVDLSRPRTRGRGLGIHYDPEAFGRFSEAIARTLGTARFLVAQTAVVVVWITINVVAVSLRWDPYPFILLNLAFSTQAAYAAPLILLAQNRQAERDKAQTERDREVVFRTQADTEFLGRELAAVRIALTDVATADDLNRAVERITSVLAAGPDTATGTGSSAGRSRRIGSPRTIGTEWATAPPTAHRRGERSPIACHGRLESRPMPTPPLAHQPRQAADDGACGIGFVADAHGRSSRAIVEAALDGLACVKHRGAAAADGRTADGAGVLLPIPAAMFGPGNGVATLFCRGDDPRAAVELAAKEEGIEVVEWRAVPTDDAYLGSQALATKPEILQAVLAGATATSARPSGCAGASRRRPTGCTSSRAPSAPWSTRGWPPPTRCGASSSTSTTSGSRRRSPCSTSASAPTPRRPGSGRSPSGCCATTARSTPSRATRTGCGPGPCSAPSAPASGRGAVPADPRPGGLRLREARRRRGAAHEGGRDIRHAIAMLVPEAWENARDLDPEVRGFYRYHSALMEPWDGPAGIIFTDGLGVGAALDRNGLRPLRYAVCEDGFVTVCSEVGAVDTSGHGTVQRGRLRPGQMLFVDPTRGVQLDAELKERISAGSYARWAADGLLDISRGEPVVVTPDPTELERRQATHGLHAGGPRHGPQADGRRRPRARLLDGRRLPPAPPGRSRPSRPPLPAPALRPGHEPPDRPRAGAPGDEPAHPARTPAADPVRGAGGRPPPHHVLVLHVPLGGGDAPRLRPLPVHHRRHRRHFPRAEGPPGCGRPWTACATRRRPPSRAAPASW
jgi:uncharacterized membrane protein